jgi:hypothetical protein
MNINNMYFGRNGRNLYTNKKKAQITKKKSEQFHTSHLCKLAWY